MSIERQPLEPLRPDFQVRYLSEDQLDQLQTATLEVLEFTGVRFPSEKALAIFADHSAQVDWESQIVKLPPDLVKKALASVPRYFVMGGRDSALDLHLQDGLTYFTSDGLRF